MQNQNIELPPLVLDVRLFDQLPEPQRARAQAMVDAAASLEYATTKAIDDDIFDAVLRTVTKHAGRTPAGHQAACIAVLGSFAYQAVLVYEWASIGYLNAGAGRIDPPHFERFAPAVDFVRTLMEAHAKHRVETIAIRSGQGSRA